MTAALAAGFTACSDDKDEQPAVVNQITINGTSQELKSALYMQTSDPGCYPGYDLFLFTEKFESFPQDESVFLANIEITENLLGQTIDLTKPLPKTGELEPYVSLGTNDYDMGFVSEITDPSIISGTLRVTKNNDNFTVELTNLSVNLSETEKFNVSCTWTGVVKETNIPD